MIDSRHSNNGYMNNNRAEFQYLNLIEEVKKAGAIDVIPIRTSDIVIEERIQLKCRTGCPSYGKSLTCPPYAPKISEFKRMLQEYHDALLIRFRSTVETEPEIIHSLLKNKSDPTVSQDVKERTIAFSNALDKESKAIHDSMLDIERKAFLAGYPLAVAFTVDSCDLCKTCNVKGGVCMHPSQLRYSIEAVGINIIETAKSVGMKIQFPCPIPPDRITLLLVN